MQENKKDIVEQVKEEARKEIREKVEKETGPEKTAEPVAQQVLKQIPFFNTTNLKFIDISHEQFRQYLFSNGAKIEIQYPLKLGISRNNIHRVFDVTGLSYYIPPTWIAVVTKPRPGGPDIIM